MNETHNKHIETTFMTAQFASVIRNVGRSRDFLSREILGADRHSYKTKQDRNIKKAYDLFFSEVRHQLCIKSDLESCILQVYNTIASEYLRDPSARPMKPGEKEGLSEVLDEINKFRFPKKGTK